MRNKQNNVIAAWFLQVLLVCSNVAGELLVLAKNDLMWMARQS